MKTIWQSIKIINMKENNGQTVIQAVIDESKENLLKYATDKGIVADIKLCDGKSINHEQRKKFYATIGDISEHTGYPPEYLKELFKFWYCAESGQEYFSMSDCTLEVARELINFIIEFALMNDIPLSESALERTDDISKYLYHCIKFKKCCICGSEGTTYTIDGFKNKICICNSHYDVAKFKGLKAFNETYKVYGIQFVG